MNNKSKRLQFWALNIASFFGQMGISMANLAIVYYIRYTIGADASIVGLAASTYTSCYLIFCIALSRFYQRFKPRYMVESSVLLMGLSLLGITLTHSLPLIFILLIGYGFAMSMLWPQVEAWITRDMEGAELHNDTSAFNFSWSFGTGVSPYVASLLITIKPSFGFYGAAFFFVLIYLIIFTISFISSDIRYLCCERDHIKGKKEEKLKDNSTPLRYYSWIAVFLVYSALSVVLNIFPMYAKEVLQIGDDKSGLLLLIRGLSTCFAFVYFGAVSWWQFKAWLIFLMEALFAVVAIVFAKSASFASISIFFILFGVIFSLCYSFSIFHSASGAIDRGKRMMIHEVILTVGQVIGASIGGTIYQFLGFSNVLYALGGLSLVLLPVQIGVYSLHKRKK